MVRNENSLALAAALEAHLAEFSPAGHAQIEETKELLNPLLEKFVNGDDLFRFLLLFNWFW